LLFSITFDIFFILQHYVLYRNHREYEPLEGSPDPILNPHEDMTTSNHVITSSLDETGEPHRSASIDSLRQSSEGYQNQDDWSISKILVINSRHIKLKDAHEIVIAVCNSNSQLFEAVAGIYCFNIYSVMNVEVVLD